MKRKIVVLSMSLALAAPIALTQIAAAQVTPAAVVAQTGSQAEMNAFYNSTYSYYDALVLGRFWGLSASDSKAMIGFKLKMGGKAKAILGMTLGTARAKAAADAESLNFFFKSGFDYQDAEDIAKFWGDASAFDGKVRIERCICTGQADSVHQMLSEIRGGD